MDLNWEFVPLPESSETGVSVLTFDGLLNPGLQVEQDGGAAGCGGKLWPAGDLLSRYLIRLPATNYRKVLELGAGTGLAGLAFAMAHPKSGAKTYITDMQQLVPLMAQNIRINDLENLVSAKVLDWGAPLPDYTQGTDLILAADVVYLESAFPLLERTLLDLTGDGTPIIMAYKKRRKADRHFFRAARKHFEIVDIVDFPEYESFRKDSVFLFEMKRKLPSKPRTSTSPASGAQA